MLGEVRRLGEEVVGAGGDLDELGLSSSLLGGRDVALGFHLSEHVALPNPCLVPVPMGGVITGTLRQASDDGGLGQGDVLGVLSEVDPRGRLDPVGT